MTSQGSAYTRFKRALESGSATVVLAAAAEVPHIELGDALRVCWTLGLAGEGLYDRAAIRWLGRFCLEGESVEVADVRAAARAFESIAGGTGARDALALLEQLCRKYGL